MFSFLSGMIVPIIQGIISNIIFNRFKSENPTQTVVHHVITDNRHQDNTNQVNRLDNWRAYNRIQLDNKILSIFFPLVSYLAIGGALYTSIVLTAGFNEPWAVDLATTRIKLDFIITQDNIFKVCSISAILLYLPIWYFAKRVSYFICSRIIYNFSEVTTRHFLGIAFTFTLFIASFIGGNSYYFLNPEANWWKSISFSFFAFFLLIYLAIKDRNQQVYS